MAAMLVVNKKNHVLCQAAPAQGKSWVILLVAAYLSYKEPTSQVVIFSSTGILMTQLEKKYKLLPDNM